LKQHLKATLIIELRDFLVKIQKDCKKKSFFGQTPLNFGKAIYGSKDTKDFTESFQIPNYLL
jgi:hypothetical protein